jgi:long-chain acyl-CoA synthetase
VKRAVFGLAIGVAQDAADARSAGPHAEPPPRIAHRLADRVVLSKVRAVFGGRLKLALTGGAPIEPEILRFFDACGVPVLEGYGMTETTAVSTVNTLQHRRPGTVGRALSRCELRIAEDGEVLIRGPHVFAGYHRNEEATAAALTSDGWLRTGDLGRLDQDGFLTITGRKKELIITSSGKNVSPANVENAIRRSPWLGQVVVVGDRRPFLVALVTLDAAEAPGLAAELGVERARRAALDAGRCSERRRRRPRGQRALRADLAGQAGRHPRARADRRRRRADADPEGQAPGRVRVLRGGDRAALRRRAGAGRRVAEGGD